jgi:hypothetical protein
VALLQTLILPIPVDNSWLNPQPPMGTLSLPLEQMNLQFPILLTVYLLDISATYKAQTEDIGWQVDLRLWSLRWSWLQILFIITKRPRSLCNHLLTKRGLWISYLRGIDIEDCEGTHDARTTSKKKKNGEILRLRMN